MTYTVIFQNNAPVSASFNEVRVDGKFRSLFHVKFGAMETMLSLKEMVKLSDDILAAVEQHAFAVAAHIANGDTAIDNDGTPFVLDGHEVTNLDTSNVGTKVRHST